MNKISINNKRVKIPENVLRIEEPELFRMFIHLLFIVDHGTVIATPETLRIFFGCESVDLVYWGLISLSKYGFIKYSHRDDEVMIEILNWGRYAPEEKGIVNG